MKRTMLTLAAMTILSLNAFAGDDLADLTAGDIMDAAVAIDSLSDSALDVDALAAQTENKGTAQEACCHGWGGWGGYGCGYGSYYGGYNFYNCYRPCYYSYYRPCYTYSYAYPVCYGGYGGYWGCY